MTATDDLQIKLDRWMKQVRAMRAARAERQAAGVPEKPIAPLVLASLEATVSATKLKLLRMQHDAQSQEKK